MAVSWRMLLIRSPSISLRGLLMLNMFFSGFIIFPIFKKTCSCKTISLKYSTVYQLIFLNMLLFHSGTFHVFSWFLSPPCCKFDSNLWPVDEHDPWSIKHTQISDSSFNKTCRKTWKQTKKKASWEANNASFTNLKRNARIPSFPEISTSQDDTSTSPTAPGIPGTGSTPRSSSTHTSIGHRLPKPGTWEFHSVENINIIYIYIILYILYMQFLHIYIYTIMSWDHNHHNHAMGPRPSISIDYHTCSGWSVYNSGTSWKLFVTGEEISTPGGPSSEYQSVSGCFSPARNTWVMTMVVRTPLNL